MYILGKVSEVAGKVLEVAGKVSLICQKCDTFLGNSVCIPFIIPIDTEPGFLQALFLQIRPIGQSISLLHWTEMSPTSSMSWKFGPIGLFMEDIQ